VSELVGLRIEAPAVFDAVHDRVLALAAAGIATGFRIDHIDGLRDPESYLKRLRTKLAALRQPDFYIIVEKILSGNERLPANWPVEGTTGYDFLNAVNLLFTSRDGIEKLSQFYREITRSPDWQTVLYRSRCLVIRKLFAAEMTALKTRLWHLARKDRHAKDLPFDMLASALFEVTASLPVYRTYTCTYPVRTPDRHYIGLTLERVLRRKPQLRPALTFLAQLLLPADWDYLPPTGREERLSFLCRWQQLTGAVTAKGLEDTALYRYSPLLALGEVGCTPGRTRGTSVAAFHARNQAILSRWPYTLNATSTHDTKRSEDVRARLSILSEIPERSGRISLGRGSNTTAPGSQW